MSQASPPDGAAGRTASSCGCSPVKTKAASACRRSEPSPPLPSRRPFPFLSPTESRPHNLRAARTPYWSGHPLCVPPSPAPLAADGRGCRGERRAPREAVSSQSAAASLAAQQSRAAAARCDVEGGAPAASRAANAFADRCLVACIDSSAPTLAAREAAYRCVLSRDDVDVAALVARKTSTWRDHLRGTQGTARESIVGHKKVSKDAAAAALAARKAALRCAAASRHAVSAASLAREVASRCDAVGGAGAAAAARQAADRCVSERADAAAMADADVAEAAARDAAAGLAVPLADAAALEARKAAASCDEALVGEDADEFLDKMRGWVMTVATLFVGMAFQAIVHPPDGMSWDQCARFTSPKAGKTASGPLVHQLLENFWLTAACSYLYANTLTMAVALALVVVLLTMKKATSRIALLYIQLMLASLAFMVAASFITGISGNQRLKWYVFIFFAVYAINTFLFVKRGIGFIKKR